jgi:dinuclear metal center YbgI/SA1388 family protein
MRIAEIINFLESLAHPSLQESYDNAGLITGDPQWNCSGIVCSLDATEDVVNEAISRKCNLIVAHHPIIFGGLKKINGKNYVEKTVISAIKNDIAIFAIHTNLDNIANGVNGKIAEMMGLKDCAVLSPKAGILKKLFTFVPLVHANAVRDAVFAVGAGHIGNYSECSFNAEGIGTFKAGSGTDPFTGQIGERHHENEIKIEVIFPAFLEGRIVQALKTAHPYEEVAFDVVSLSNSYDQVGSGMIGDLAQPLTEIDFLSMLKSVFGCRVVRHTALTSKTVKRIAVCGGAGSFLISIALSKNADAFVTADLKYHEFFDANGRALIADIGHYESEQFTIDLLQDVLLQKFPTFAVLKTEVKTNPVYYF